MPGPQWIAATSPIPVRPSRPLMSQATMTSALRGSPLVPVPRTVAAFLSVLTVALVSACGVDADQATRGILTDSADVRMVQLPAPGAIESDFHLLDEPVYRVGWDPGGRAFETITDGALLPDGTAVIADGGNTQQLVLIDPSGSIRAVLGGSGEGPGEFRRISSVAAGRGDTILVQDPTAGRLTKLTPNGQVQTLRSEDLMYLHLYGAGPGSGELLLGMPLATVFGRRYDTPFLAVPLARLDWNSEQADTLAMADWDQSISTGGGNNPFMSGGFVGLSGEDFVVGRSDRAELRWIDPSGAVRQIVRWDAPSVAVPDSLLAEWESRMREWLEGAGLPAADVNERIDAMKEAVQEPLPQFGLSGSMPSAGGVVGDSDGNVWIAEYSPPGHGPPGRYFVMSPEGEWLGPVRIPDGARVLAIGREHVLAVETDPLDVQAAVLYRIQR